VESVYPRGGWGRAINYIKHRLRRLPGTPESVGRGIAVGVFTTFTPFYGLHFIVAAICARLIRGNILAALLATFFGNPFTYVPIAFISLSTGHFILGTENATGANRSLFGKFVDAGSNLWDNFMAVFTDRVAHWDQLDRFFQDVFWPFLVGGLAPGIVAGVISYYLSVPIIRAYQNRRKGQLKAKLAALKKKAMRQADDPAPLD
jgi:uncharacterized protein (DUF2062 family)